MRLWRDLGALFRFQTPVSISRGSAPLLSSRKKSGVGVSLNLSMAVMMLNEANDGEGRGAYSELDLIA